VVEYCYRDVVMKHYPGDVLYRYIIWRGDELIALEDNQDVAVKWFVDAVRGAV
jgi:hypothetical protein